ncbi:MAG: DNA repair protein RadA [Chlamydiales bacterium]|nr:DNA repair protein RadA [Chlamydiales bacterium]
MAKTKTVWMCNDCGNTHIRWAGSCSACKAWNTLVEMKDIAPTEKRYTSQTSKRPEPRRVLDVEATEGERMQSGMGEFDRLMGNGLVRGSLTLVGGDPGIGKSTMLLQLSNCLAMQGLTVLYVCGEESAAQTSMRARRIKATSDKLFLLSETQFSNIHAQIDKLNPDVLIIDSVQIVYKDDIPSAPGSVTQVKEVALECMHLSKGRGITTFLIGHVTKSGEIAGPRVLEHLVDTALYFEGDQQHGYRLLRSIKNRFGPTDDVAIFQMCEEGLKEVPNPSAVFLEERNQGSSGCAIIPTVEGARAFLIEVQALVAPSSYSTSSRRCTGLDQNRLALLLAVLEKRMGYKLHALDVFVSVAGGMKIKEPAVDLGTLLAIASSFCNQPIHPETAVVGEVGLSGEVRSVPRIETRIKEAINMGFTTLVLPSNCLKGLSSTLTSKINLRGIDVVEDAIHLLLP